MTLSFCFTTRSPALFYLLECNSSLRTLYIYVRLGSLLYLLFTLKSLFHFEEFLRIYQAFYSVHVVSRRDVFLSFEKHSFFYLFLNQIHGALFQGASQLPSFIRYYNSNSNNIWIRRPLRQGQTSCAAFRFPYSSDKNNVSHDDLPVNEFLTLTIPLLGLQS